MSDQKIIDAQRGVRTSFTQRFERAGLIATKRASTDKALNFSIKVPADLIFRRIYLLVDVRTTLNATGNYWYLNGTLTALSGGLPIASWPHKIGHLTHPYSGFIDGAASLFTHGASPLEYAIRFNAKNEGIINHVSLPTFVYPFSVSLPCDEIQWRYVNSYGAPAIPPATTDQVVEELRVFLACRSES
jgi:hypothetical protein